MSEPSVSRKEIKAKAAEQRKERVKEYKTVKGEYKDIIDFQVTNADPILQRNENRYVNL